MCEGWRACGGALAGVVGGRDLALTFSHAVARDLCFAVSLCSLLLFRALCVRSWAAVAASHTSPKLVHGFLSGVRTVLAVCMTRVFSTLVCFNSCASVCWPKVLYEYAPG